MGSTAGSEGATYAEYLAFDAAADWLHEYVDGRIRPVAPSTSRHAAISCNVGVSLGLPLRGTRCRATGCQQRIRVPATGASFYADASVICGLYQVAEDDRDAVTNPTVIAEVLSPESLNYDQGTKFDHYRRLPSLQHVLFVSPREQQIQHRQRLDDGWRITYHTEGVVHLTALGIDLALDDVYGNLDMVDGPAAE